MCASQSCVQQFYTIKIKPFKIRVQTLQQEYTYNFFFFCRLNCFKKILNVKILVWEFCRKTHISPSVRPVSPFPNSSAPSVRAQGPYLLARDQCKMITVKHQPATAPENTQPLRDPEMSKLGGFGPKHTSLCSFIKWTGIPAVRRGFWLCLSCYRKQGLQHRVAKAATHHFHPSLVAQSWHTRNGNSGGKSCVMKTIN